MSFWDDEANVDRLRKMHADRLSCGRMAIEFGGLISRNAIIGQLRRLGLDQGRRATSGNGAVLAAARRAKAKLNYRSPKARAARESHAAEIRNQFAAVEIVDLPPDQSAVAVPFYNLNKETCRWPLGDPRDLEAMRFCGDQPFSSYVYCERHARIAYVPLARRHAA